MKKIIVLFISLISCLLINAMVIKAGDTRKFASLPTISDNYTEYGWNCTMNTLKNLDGSVTINKGVSENGIASIYYQKLGEKIEDLEVSEYVGIQLEVTSEEEYSGNGLLFKYSGNEIELIEAYDEGSSLDIASRDLNFNGTRTYVIPFGEIDALSIGEFQIGIWGSSEVSITIKNIKLVYTGDETPIVQVEKERRYASLPGLEGNYTEYGYNCTLVNTLNEDGSVTMAKTNSNSGIGSIYYQTLGLKIKALGLNDYYGIAVDVTSNVILNGNGMLFKYSNIEIGVVEAYDEGTTTNLATRDLSFDGTRTYIIPFASIDPEGIGEFQIGIWGPSDATVSVNNIRLVYLVEKHVHSYNGYLSDKDVHWQKCLECEELTEKSYHIYGAWEIVDEATEEATGLRKQICSVCGYVNEEIIPELSHVHDFSGEWLFNETEHYKECSGSNCNEKSEQANHTFGDYIIIKNATCEEEGSKKAICSVCGYEKIESIPKLNHNYSSEYLYDETGHYHKCLDCNTLSTKEAHTFGEWEIIEEATYEKNGSKKRTCSVCGYVDTLVIPMLVEYHYYTLAPLSGNITEYGYMCVFTTERNNDGTVIMKKEASENGIASIYYQTLGDIINKTDSKNNYGIRLTVSSDKVYPGSGLMFTYSGVEVSVVEAYDLDSNIDLATRDLDFVGTRTYIIPFGEIDALSIGEFQIGIWGIDAVQITIENIELVYTGDEIGGEPIVGPVFEKEPAYSYQISSFDTEEDVLKWNVSGTTGTVFKKSLNTNPEYVKEGSGSLKYVWTNELYQFGYTEIYLDVSKLIQEHLDSSIKGVTFWIYSTSEQTIGEVGWWLKGAEKDGSEYEASYKLLQDGTHLEFTGWKKIFVPFTAFDEAAWYALDENDFDTDQLAFIKIGYWSNKPDVVEIECYIDDVRLVGEKEFKEPTNNPNTTTKENGNTSTNPNQSSSKSSCKSGCKGSSKGFMVSLFIMPFVLVGFTLIDKRRH